MNILHVVPYFAPAWAYGGPPRSVYELSRALVRDGHSVTVLTSDAYDALSRAPRATETLDGIEVIRLRNLSNRLSWDQQLFLPMGTSKFLRDHLREFDLVHMHMFRTYQNVAVHRNSMRQGVPYVFSAHGSLPRIVRWQRMKSIYDTTYGYRVLRDARRLIAVSRKERAQYEAARVPSDKVSVVANGIDSAEYSKLPPPGTFSKSAGLEGKRLVTFVGRLNPRKGLEHLLSAFAQLSASRNDLELILVGPDDGYRVSLERLARRLSIADRVLFTGLITIPEKLQVLVDSDVVVYPGAYEIFGLVPFEALLCGKPVVVANDSGCGEIIESAQAGLTVPIGSPESLRGAIVSALEGTPVINDMVKRGKQFVLSQLDWSRIAEQMESVYMAACGS